MSKRVEYIDIAKGIGILLVVMGHNDFGLVSPFFYRFIYAFHMPLFFFVSGMFFKDDQQFVSLFRRRFETLLKPFIVILLFILFMTISFTKVNFDVAIFRFIKAMYANGHYLDWVQLWFIPHLFALNIFAFGYYKLTNRIGYKAVKWGVLIIMLVVGVKYLGMFWPFSMDVFGKSLSLYGFPLSLDLIFVSGFFFILGCEVNKTVRADFFSNPMVAIGSLAGLYGLLIYFPATIDFNTRFYESLVINTAEAVLGILFVFAISRQIEKNLYASSFFRYIGQASLIILIFHVPIQETWGEKVLFMVNNQNMAYWVAYVAGIVFPLLINHYLILPNPIVRNWFGYKNVDGSFTGIKSRV